MLLTGQAQPPTGEGDGPGWKPDELDPSFLCSLEFLSVFLLEKGSLAYLLVQDVHTLVFSLRRPTVRKPSYSVSPRLTKLASYSGWGPVPPGPLASRVRPHAVLYSLPWLFVFCFRKNTGVPWHASGQDLALSVAQVQSVVQELRSLSWRFTARAAAARSRRAHPFHSQ